MKKVVFVHPDLGVGGAERLVVDAALSLKNRFDVCFVTSHHDPSHCFQETKDGTLPVIVVGDWMPRSIFGKFYALCAYLRMILCSLYVILFMSPDVVFCDLVSICIPILHLKVKKVMFYCHFPDQLLSQRGSWLKSIYRAPINWLEERTTKCADKIFVNSEFTLGVFKQTFPSIDVVPDILHPSINVSFFDQPTNSTMDSLVPEDAFVFLSINRYERKKYVELAIKALSCMEKTLSKEEWDKVFLIIAGGYDSRVDENVEYYSELNATASNLKLTNKIIFLKSPSDSDKVALLKRCNCVLYTPPNEHFGIVPLEAMYCKKPVVAVNSGGPTETIEHPTTGFLCDFTSQAFAYSCVKLIKKPSLVSSMGEAGRKRFLKLFSFQAFGDQLNKSVNELLST